jgi:hypothetical protein
MKTEFINELRTYIHSVISEEEEYYKNCVARSSEFTTLKQSHNRIDHLKTLLVKIEEEQSEDKFTNYSLYYSIRVEVYNLRIERLQNFLSHTETHLFHINLSHSINEKKIKRIVSTIDALEKRFFEK